MIKTRRKSFAFLSLARAADKAKSSLTNAAQISDNMCKVLSDSTDKSSKDFSTQTQKTLTNLEAEAKRILDVHLSGALATFHQDF